MENVKEKLRGLIKAISKVVAAIALTVSVMSVTAGEAYAQTPTITPIDSDATQLLVNGVASIQSALFTIAGLIWPYALTVLLFFLAIRFGMRWFHGGAH